jgi:hypothetical protein
MVPVYAWTCGLLRAKDEAALLRSDNAAEGVAARQDDAAMVDFGFWRGGALECGIDGPVGKGSAAGWAPVGAAVSGEDGVALGADTLHLV